MTYNIISTKKKKRKSRSNTDMTWDKWTTEKAPQIDVKKKKKNETQFLPGSGCVDTAIWMHYMDAN